jgi:hypothetical protein
VILLVQVLDKSSLRKYIFDVNKLEVTTNDNYYTLHYIDAKDNEHSSGPE